MFWQPEMLIQLGTGHRPSLLRTSACRAVGGAWRRRRVAVPSVWTSAWYHSQSSEYVIISRLAGRDGSLLECGEGGAVWVMTESWNRELAANIRTIAIWLLSYLMP